MPAPRPPSAAARILRVTTTCLAGCGAAAIVLTAWLLLGWPLFVDRWLDVSTAPQPADAIVCIGAGVDSSNLPLEEGWRRIFTAVQLYADGHAPVVVFSGGMGSVSEAQAYAHAAAWLGLPADAAILDPKPTSTAEHPRTLLESGARLTRDSRVLVIASGLQSRRVLLSFRKHGFSRVRVVSEYSARRSADVVPAGLRVSSVDGFRRSAKVYDDPFRRLKGGTDVLLNSLREIAALGWYWWRGLV